MNKYESHKVVEAGRITGVEDQMQGDVEIIIRDQAIKHTVTREVFQRIQEMAEPHGGVVSGWLMLYPDGYVSWSPEKAFNDGYDLLQPTSGKSKIAGYRELNEGEVAAINDVKGVGAMLGDFIDIQRQDDQCDQRWVSIGATHLQQGLMCLTRAIAKPEFF